MKRVLDYSCNNKCFMKKVNKDFTVPVTLASIGWQIKQALQYLGVHPLQYSGSIIPQPLWGHSSMDSSYPWQFKSDSHTLSAPWLVAVHSLFENLCFTGGPWRSWRHITSADRYVKSGTAQIVPHVPLCLTCTWPACDVSIPNKRTSTSAVKVREMTNNFMKQTWSSIDGTPFFVTWWSYTKLLRKLFPLSYRTFPLTWHAHTQTFWNIRK